jgi:hypothetical protein
MAARQGRCRNAGSAAEAFIVHGRAVQYRLGCSSAPKRYD